MKVVDEDTREYLAIKVDASLSATRIVRVFEYLKAARGVSERLQIYIGSDGLYPCTEVDLYEKHTTDIIFVRSGKT